jgi:hypothetical protein
MLLTITNDRSLKMTTYDSQQMTKTAHAPGRALDLGLPEKNSIVMLCTAKDVVAALDNKWLIEKTVPFERSVQTAEGVRLAIDCLVWGKRS